VQQQFVALGGPLGQWASPSRSSSWAPIQSSFLIPAQQLALGRDSPGCSRQLLAPMARRRRLAFCQADSAPACSLMAEGGLGANRQCANGAPWRTRQARCRPTIALVTGGSSGCLDGAEQPATLE